MSVGGKLDAGSPRKMRTATVRRFLSDTVALVKAPTHNPQAQLMIKDGVDRSVCDLMETLQRLVGIVGYTRGITQ